METSNLEDCSICSICGTESNDLYVNLESVKSAHSETSVARILKRLFTKASMNIEYKATTDNLAICQGCLDKIDECDLAYTKAIQIENALINIVKSKDAKILKNLKSTTQDYSIIPRTKNFDDVDNDGEMMISTQEGSMELFFISKQDGDDYFNDCSTDESDISSDNEKNILCEICKEVFDTLTAYEVHLPSHDDKNIYSCQMCKESFDNYCAYDVHQNIHLGKSELECRYCLKVWKKRSLAVKHNRVHTKPYDYQCERCGKRFVHESSLRAHFLAHDDVRKVSCNICHRLFRVQANLTSHMLTHSGERPFSCDICGRKFSKQYNLKEHRKIHVPVNNFECRQCGLVFRKQTELDNHVKEVHPEVYQSRKRFTLSKTRVPVYDENYTTALSTKENSYS